MSVAAGFGMDLLLRGIYVMGGVLRVHRGGEGMQWSSMGLFGD